MVPVQATYVEHRLSHRKVESFGYPEDKIEIYSFDMNFSSSEIRIEVKSSRISENNSEIKYISIVFRRTETRSEILYFSWFETKKENMSLGTNFSHAVSNSFS